MLSDTQTGLSCTYMSGAHLDEFHACMTLHIQNRTPWWFIRPTLYRNEAVSFDQSGFTITDICGHKLGFAFYFSNRLLRKHLSHDGLGIRNLFELFELTPLANAQYSRPLQHGLWYDFDKKKFLAIENKKYAARKYGSMPVGLRFLVLCISRPTVFSPTPSSPTVH